MLHAWVSSYFEIRCESEFRSISDVSSSFIGMIESKIPVDQLFQWINRFIGYSSDYLIFVAEFSRTIEFA
jgi:hypothetical protein